MRKKARKANNPYDHQSIGSRAAKRASKLSARSLVEVALKRRRKSVPKARARRKKPVSLRHWLMQKMLRQAEVLQAITVSVDRARRQQLEAMRIMQDKVQAIAKLHMSIVTNLQARPTLAREDWGADAWQSSVIDALLSKTQERSENRKQEPADVGQDQS